MGTTRTVRDAAPLTADIRLRETPTDAALTALRTALVFGNVAEASDAVEALDKLLANGEPLPRRWRARHLRRGEPFRSSCDLAARFRDLERLDNEEFHVVYVDARHRCIATERLSVGTPSEAPVSTQAVLRAALVRGAAAVALVHNHPAGDCAPSAADREFTAAMKRACAAVDLTLLDHVIVATGGAFSFLDAGLLSAAK